MYQILKKIYFEENTFFMPLNGQFLGFPIELTNNENASRDKN